MSDFSPGLPHRGSSPPDKPANAGEFSDRRRHASFHTVYLIVASPDACIMKQKLLNPPGDSEGQAGVEALRVALNC
jgi:hypothetical protein